ncbi:MAG: carbohydrate ABC transporter permease [Ruminococcaceae bacterium]|nr:carbohydrate ABC transporter permease [Oscillospiraceae bacterium]
MKRSFIKKKTLKKIPVDIICYILLFGLCFIILKPFSVKILSAFMSQDDLVDITVQNIPKNWSLFHWETAFKGLRIADAGLKTLLLSTLAAVIQTISSAMVGYGLARFKFKGRTLALVIVMVIMLIPSQVTEISQFMYFGFFGIGSFQLNLLNTPWMTVLLSIGTLGFKQGLYIYFYRAFFMGLPVDLENAAYIDGASVMKTFWQIILPNAKAIMSTVFLLSFCWQWTDVDFAKTFLDVYRPLTLSIETINAETIVSTAISRNAAAVLIILPLIVLFLICQKNLIKSLSQSGLAN